MAEDFSWKRLNTRSKIYIILLAVFVFYLTVFKHFFPSKPSEAPVAPVTTPEASSSKTPQEPASEPAPTP